MAADRRIDAAGGIGKFGEQRLVKRSAHAVEPLEFVTVDAAGVLDNTRDRQRVVRGKLRKQPVAGRQQSLDAGRVTKIGHRLAGEDRIIGEAALLGAFDLGVPIGPLDQAHRQLAVCRRRDLLHPVDYRRRAFLIGLHRDPKPVPALERAVAKCRGDDIE